MINLNDEYYALDINKCPDNLGYLRLEDIDERNFDSFNCAIKLDFKNDFESNVQIIKKVMDLTDKKEFYSLCENKKVKFFNLIAKEKNDIPSDIYNGVMNYEEKWDEVRKVLSKGDNNYD